MALNKFHEWKKDASGEIDIFAYERLNHNGPRCVLCGRAACHHCNPKIYEELCPAKKSKNEEVEK